MVIATSLELTGKKCVTAERDAGIIIFSTDSKAIELSYDEANLLLEFLIKKREMEAGNV
ncbi:MAG: hypothetical protein H6Q65_1153 [Firmicutes bacterium]|nr:hypothetical protein [Bacillota bacterium]